MKGIEVIKNKLKNGIKISSGEKGILKQMGKRAFIEMVQDCDLKLDECIKLCGQIFGKCDLEEGLEMRFGQVDKSFIKPIAIMLKEMLEKSKGVYTIHDIKELQNGAYSYAIKAGDYVFKIGKERCTRKIQNDKRILQPIIRQRMNPQDEYGEFNYIEVQNVVDTDWGKNLSYREREEVVYRLYAELRDRGIVWIDAKQNNIGKLIRPNKPNFEFVDKNGEKVDIKPTKKATDMKGKVDEVLEPGDFVILDTDCMEEAKPGEKVKAFFSSEYEERYQKERKMKKAHEKKSKKKESKDESKYR